MPDIISKLDALVDAIKALQSDNDPRVRILLGTHDADDFRAEALRLANDMHTEGDRTLVSTAIDAAALHLAIATTAPAVRLAAAE